MSAGAMFAISAASAVTQIAGGYATSKQADINARLYEQQGAFYQQQGDLNAMLYEQKAGFLDELSKLAGDRLDFAMRVDLTQIRRAKSKMASTLMARTAYSGLEFSGSPVAVMVENLTQAGIDEELTKYDYTMEKIASEYNYAQEKIAAKAQASNARLEGTMMNISSRMEASNLRYAGRTARNVAYSNAFTTLLKGGFNYGVRSGKIKVAGGGAGKL